MSKHILHLLSPAPNISPFDANMALDAGFDAVLPYTGVTQDQVAGLVQDAMFSRPPKQAVNTGVFFSGKDALLALDMMDVARKAMVPPFIVSLFADPAGSFTTAAAMVAKAEQLLARDGASFRGRTVTIFGATGVVGFASAVIAAEEGATVVMAGHDGAARVGRSAAEIAKRFGVHPQAADASTEERKADLLTKTDVVFCAGRAGVQIISAEQLRGAPNLLVAADVNAVPPPGVAGLDVMSDGAELPGTKAKGIGALAIGRLKYSVQFGLFRQMIEAAKPVQFDFRQAFALAKETLKGQS